MKRRIIKADTNESTTHVEKKLHSSTNKKSTSLFLYFCARLICIILSLIIAVIALLAYILVTRFGFGEADTQWDAKQFASIKPLLDDSALEPIVKLPIPPGNVAVSQEGEVFFTFHPVYSNSNPTGVKIGKVTGITSFTAWPSVEFQSQVTSVLSLRIDSTNTLWALDHCEMGFLCTPALYGISVTSGSLTHTHKFPSHVAGMGSFLNDFQIDEKVEFMYITDTSTLANTPALIVYNIKEDVSRRVISSHASMFGQSLFLEFGGIVTRIGPIGFTTHVDGISLSRDGGMLFYSSVTSHNMYSIPTQYLNDSFNNNDNNYNNDNNNNSTRAKDGNDPSRHIQLVSSEKPVSDGQAQDERGNIWITAFADNALAILSPVSSTRTRSSDNKEDANANVNNVNVNVGESETMKYELVKVLQSSQLRWCDGLSFGPDGLYVTESALHLKLFGKCTSEDKGKGKGKGKGKIDKIVKTEKTDKGEDEDEDENKNDGSDNDNDNDNNKDEDKNKDEKKSSASVESFEKIHAPFMIYRVGIRSLKDAFGEDYTLPMAGQ